MNELLSVGSILLVALLAGHAARRLRVPEVTGYILAGVAVGPSGLHWLSADNLSAIEVLGEITLGLILFWRVIPPFWAAFRRPEPAAIRLAVKRGVLSLVLLDAALAASYANTLFALAVLATGLLAALLARSFAVT